MAGSEETWLTWLTQVDSCAQPFKSVLLITMYGRGLGWRVNYPLRVHVLVGALAALAAPLCAQQDRINVAIESSHPIRLVGTVHPKASLQNDVGLVDPLQPLDYVSLIPRKTPVQQSALERLLEEQQDSSSPNYHRWLTPERYADRFGVSPNDLAKVVAWLQAMGLKVEGTARGRDWIAFSGTVSEVQTAFHTQFHRYRVDGEDHFANATDASVPGILAD
jgi:subtilase family serine protease